MSNGFEEEDDDLLEDSFVDGMPTLDPPGVPVIGAPAEEEAWDENDFDEDFDQDFDDEPDEDLLKFEQELNKETIETDKDFEADFEEDF